LRVYQNAVLFAHDEAACYAKALLVGYHGLGFKLPGSVGMLAYFHAQMNASPYCYFLILTKTEPDNRLSLSHLFANPQALRYNIMLINVECFFPMNEVMAGGYFNVSIQACNRAHQIYAGGYPRQSNPKRRRMAGHLRDAYGNTNLGADNKCCWP
jgi:hypothetical protein